MTLTMFLRFMKSAPFEPFFIRATDGGEHLIGHPEEVNVSAGGETIHVFHRTGQFESLDIRLIVSLKTAAPVNPDDYDTEGRQQDDPGTEA